MVPAIVRVPDEFTPRLSAGIRVAATLEDTSFSPPPSAGIRSRGFGLPASRFCLYWMRCMVAWQFLGVDQFEHFLRGLVRYLVS